MATASVLAPEARVFSVVEATAAAARITEARVFTIYNFPTEFEQVSEVRVLAPVMYTSPMELSEARVFAIVRGRTENRRIRAWGFSLDGHDYYVLRLGEIETLVYDLSTGQWSEWASPGLPYWRAHIGGNWLGLGIGAYANGATTTVVAGDDTLGLLWILEPDQGLDESPREDRPDAAFQRAVTGGVPMRMRETAKCNAVYVTMSLGSPAMVGAAITLRTSDDMGRTWLDHGTLTVTQDDWAQEVAWRALGLIRAPGRIFEVTDNGAATRIAGADMR